MPEPSADPLKVRRHPIWLILALGGASTFWLATGYGHGSLVRIGSGILPMALSVAIIMLSLWSFAFPRDEDQAPFALRPFVAVVLAVIFFILLIERLGMVPTVVITMLTAYLGQVQRNFLPFLLYAVLFAFAAGLLFSVALTLPIPLFGAN